MRLSQLRLRNLPQLTEVGLKSLFSSQNMSSLVSVRICDSRIDDYCILELVKCTHTSLKRLEITNCPFITDAAMYHIATFCTALENLELRELPCVSRPHYIADIIRGSPKLLHYHCYEVGTFHHVNTRRNALVPIIQRAIASVGNIPKSEYACSFETESDYVAY